MLSYLGRCSFLILEVDCSTQVGIMLSYLGRCAFLMGINIVMRLLVTPRH